MKITGILVITIVGFVEGIFGKWFPVLVISFL